MAFEFKSWRRMDGWDIVIFVLAAPAGGVLASMGLDLALRPSVLIGMGLACAGFALRRELSPALQRAEVEAANEKESSWRVLSLPVIALGIVVCVVGVLGVFLMILMTTEVGLELAWTYILGTVCLTGFGVALVAGGLRLRKL